MGDDHSDHQGSAQTPNEHDHGQGPPRGYTDSGSHALPGGLTVAVNGLRLEPAKTRLQADVIQEWTYHIHDDDGAVVTTFEETHDQLAHVILVRRDLTRFQHLHPDLTEDGTWSVTFALPDRGAYRAFVDVLVDGQPTTLGVDLFVDGAAEYDAPPDSSREASAEEYQITMTPETIPPNERTILEFEVRHDGDAVHLEPYLGALGHLVVLRDGDLAYLHVHPEETSPETGHIRFTSRFPTPGRYRLFLQAKPRDDLITTSFDVSVAAP